MMLATSALHAADEKLTSEKAQELLQKGLSELTKVANKSEDKDKDKDKEYWKRSKDHLKLDQADYLKKVQSAFTTMDLVIQSLAESGASVTTRQYYMIRLEALKQNLEYCRQEYTKLKESPSEEAFRVKQKTFDRTLGYLSDNIEVAQEEAGL